MAPRKYSKAEKQHVVELYKKGIGSTTISAKLGPTPLTILRWVREAGIRVRRISRETKQRAVKAYVEGRSSTKIADELGISSNAVLVWVREAGHPVRQPGPSTAVLTKEDKGRIVELYELGLSSKIIAGLASTSPQTVLRLVREAGQPVRPKGGRSLPSNALELPKPVVETVHQLMWADGLSQMEALRRVLCEGSKNTR